METPLYLTPVTRGLFSHIYCLFCSCVHLLYVRFEHAVYTSPEQRCVSHNEQDMISAVIFYSLKSPPVVNHSVPDL